MTNSPPKPDNYPDTKLPYWRLSSFYFYYFAFLGAWLPYWNLYLENLGLQAKDIGLLAALVLGTKIIAPSLWGWLADRGGRRTRIIRWGSLLAFLSFTSIFYSQSLLWLGLVVTVYSFFWNAVLPQYEVVTLSHLGGRFRDYSRIRLWGSIGFILAVLLLGVVFDYLHISYLPLLLGALLFGIWVSSLFVEEKQIKHSDSQSRGFWHIIAKPPVMAFLFSCFLLQIAHGPYYTFFSIYLEQAAYSRTAIGGLWSLGVLAEVVVFIYMHQIFARVSIRSIILVTLMLTVIRWLLIGFFADYWFVLLIAQCLHAASFGSYHAVAIELIRRFFKGGHEGQGQAIYSSVSFGAGGAAGALLSGQIWEISPLLCFVSASLVSLLALIVCWLWLRGKDIEEMI